MVIIYFKQSAKSEKFRLYSFVKIWKGFFLLNCLRVLCRLGYLVFGINLMFLFGTRHWANFFNRYLWHIRCFDKFNLYSILCQLEQIVFGYATVSGLLL